jgi:NPCBM/NEW2 domain
MKKPLTLTWRTAAAAVAISASLLTLGRSAQAQGGIDRAYNPFDYSKDPAHFKAPPIPKFYSEDAKHRYYTLADFKPNEKSCRKIFRNTDEKGKVLSSLDGETIKSSLCYVSIGDLENMAEYWIAGRFKTFEATIAVPESFQGKLVYYVYGDDKKLVSGDDLGKEGKTAKLSLSVEGVRRLVIKTSGNLKTEGLPVVWINPVLTETKDDD